MRNKCIILFLTVSYISLSLSAESFSCLTQYLKTLTPNEFTLQLVNQKESKHILTMIYNQFLTDLDDLTIKRLKTLLEKIQSSPQHELTEIEIKELSDLRKSSSLLRSAFELFSTDHSIPEKFNMFVVKLGGVKDYLETDPNESKDDPETTQVKASQQMKAHQNVIVKIIKLKESLSQIDFKKLIRDSSPASLTSSSAYFKQIIEQTESIIKQATDVKVDEVHQVRKNLRNILRFMELTFERERYSNKQKNSMLKDFTTSRQNSRLSQIIYLKDLNTQLGEITDKYARERLAETITKHDLVNFPEEILPKVVYFLENLKIITPPSP